MGEGQAIRCVTGKLSVHYRKPTPIDRQIELSARVAESSARKAVVLTTLGAAGVVTADAEVIAVRVADDWRAGGA